VSTYPHRAVVVNPVMARGGHLAVTDELAGEII
jgi:hypothetical protein